MQEEVYLTVTIKLIVVILHCSFKNALHGKLAQYCLCPVTIGISKGNHSSMARLKQFVYRCQMYDAT